MRYPDHYLGESPTPQALLPLGTESTVRKHVTSKGKTRYRVGIGSFMEKLKI